MAHLTTDIVDEDAADLQFPKDWTLSNKHDDDLDMPVERKKISTSDMCFTCNCSLSEPYIQCAVCNHVLLCTQCFAKGQEKSGHHNDHNYMVVKNDFPLIENCDWTAREEKLLLDLLQECGFGNWSDISRRLPGRSPEDCKRHYLQHYIDKQSMSGLPDIKETATSLFGPEPIPYSFKVQDVEDPPRFAFDTAAYNLAAGYNAARSDFEINFDNHAETSISNLKYNEFLVDDPSCHLGQELQLAIGDAYNFRLKERARRKKIIREHGLISTRKTLACMYKYDSTITKTLSSRLRIFAQLVNAIEFDSILECMHMICQLKNFLGQLCVYRNNGLKYFHSVSMFLELSKMRQEFEKDRKQYISNSECNWQSLIPHVAMENIVVDSAPKRKTAPPLEIHPGMAGYEKISDAERELCSTVRILPDSYLQMKLLLINENKKYGSVKLAQARTLLKIDVNKTRRIHAFLANEGYINGN